MKTHAIHWRSTVSGKIGTGSRLFERKEAERLATELNEGYPDIDHDAVIPVPPSAEPAVAEAA
jgi:hypothetical protein